MHHVVFHGVLMGGFVSTIQYNVLFYSVGEWSSIEINNFLKKIGMLQ